MEQFSEEKFISKGVKKRIPKWIIVLIFDVVTYIDVHQTMRDVLCLKLVSEHLIVQTDQLVVIPLLRKTKLHEEIYVMKSTIGEKEFMTLLLQEEY